MNYNDVQSLRAHLSKSMNLSVILTRSVLKVSESTSPLTSSRPRWYAQSCSMHRGASSPMRAAAWPRQHAMQKAWPQRGAYSGTHSPHTPQHAVHSPTRRSTGTVDGGAKARRRGGGRVDTVVWWCGDVVVVM